MSRSPFGLAARDADELVYAGGGGLSGIVGISSRTRERKGEATADLGGTEPAIDLGAADPATDLGAAELAADRGAMAGPRRDGGGDPAADVRDALDVETLPWRDMARAEARRCASMAQGRRYGQIQSDWHDSIQQAKSRNIDGQCTDKAALASSCTSMRSASPMSRGMKGERLIGDRDGPNTRRSQQPPCPPPPQRPPPRSGPS